jgi:hypothetical protein
LFFARNEDRTVTIFAATIDRLYMLDNTDFSWTDVSDGGSAYTPLPTNAQWQFAQFGLFVIAVNPNDDPQYFDLGTPATFENIPDNPPNSAYVSIINQFVVLSGITDNPNRVQWSDIGDATAWTPGTGSSDFQDLQDGGAALPVVGGEFGIILQDDAIRRMVFVPGSAQIFQIDRIGKNEGLLAPYSVCTAGNLIFFLSPKGFVQMDANGGITYIGREKFDRTFFAEWDSAKPHLMIGVTDPRSHKVMFAYKSASNPNDRMDKAIIYDWLIKRAAPVDLSAEFVTSLAQPGLTLENLDALAPGAMNVTDAADNGSGLIRIEVADTSSLVDGDFYTLSGVGGTTEANGTWLIDIIDGTHFDLIEDPEGNASAFSNAYTSGGIVGGSADGMSFPWDDIAVATLPNVSGVDSSHRVGFFSGDNLEATLETAEQSGDGKRLLVRGFKPITDASDVRGCVSKRENLNSSITYTNESTMNAQGFVPQLRSTPYSRGKVRIPAAAAWSYATGIRPDVVTDGDF